MASEFQYSNILKTELDISTKLSNLERRTANLESEFTTMMTSTRELAKAVKRYVDKTETERRSWNILESIFEGDIKARDILDHVKIFFNFLLAKMATKHAEITDIKMLWHLVDKEGVKEVFQDAIKSFGFNGSNESDIKLLLAVMYKLQLNMEREISVADDKENGANDTNDRIHSAENVCEGKRDDHETDVIKLTTSGKADAYNAQFDEITISIYAEENDTSKFKKTEMNQNIIEKQTLDFDHTEIPVNANDKALKAVLSWNVEDSLKNVVRRMVAIVIYTLNIGRDKKDLTIVEDNKKTVS